MNVVEIYNPVKSAELSDEQKAAMRDLTDEQIAELAEAYPNQPRGNAYLVYHMTGVKQEEQLHPLGTWQNLHNLRKLGRKDILPLAFKEGFIKRYPEPVSEPKQTRVVDLTEEEAKDAEGLKKVTEPTEPTEFMDVKDNSAELDEAERKLQEAINDKAHHMTIKSLQAKVDELKK